jgi:hypothetical protein
VTVVKIKTDAGQTKPNAKAPVKKGKAAPEKASKVTEQDDESGVEMVKVKEFLDLVSAKSDLKKKDLRDAMDAVFTTLGEALDSGKSLNLPSLGKIRVIRKVGAGAAGMLTIKLRRASPDKKAAQQALAQETEES